MDFGMLVAAVVTAVTVTGLCFAAGWHKAYRVAPLQFIATLAVTCVVGPLTVPDAYAGDAFFLALVISALMPSLFVALRVVVWCLEKSGVGGGWTGAPSRAQGAEFTRSAEDWRRG